jgi:hypothetical protein
MEVGRCSPSGCRGVFQSTRFPRDQFLDQIYEDTMIPARIVAENPPVFLEKLHDSADKSTAPQR